MKMKQNYVTRSSLHLLLSSIFLCSCVGVKSFRDDT